MNLDAVTKKLDARFGVIPTEPIALIVNGELTYYVDGKPDNFRIWNNLVPFTDNLPQTIAGPMPDADTTLKVSSIYAYNGNAFMVDLWLMENLAGVRYPWKHIQLSPGDNFEELADKGSQVLDLCGQWKIINGVCTGGDPSFLTDASFSIGW